MTETALATIPRLNIDLVKADKKTLRWLKDREQREQILDLLKSMGGGVRDIAVASMQNQWAATLVTILLADNMIRFKALDPNMGRALMAMVLAYDATLVTTGVSGAISDIIDAIIPF